MSAGTDPGLLWRELVWTEMKHRGYTADQIRSAERHRCADTCEWDGNSMRWDCFNEEGKSNHPGADEFGEIAGVVERILEIPAIAAALFTGGEE